MIKVISFLILALAVLASAEYCDRDTEYISFGGRLPEGRSMGDFCECMKTHLIETGALNKTAEFSCSPNRDFSKIEWKKFDGKDESHLMDPLGCTKCLEGCYRTEGDNAKVCDVIRKSNETRGTDIVKRVARRGWYYETGVTIYQDSHGIHISYYEILIIWD